MGAIVAAVLLTAHHATAQALSGPLAPPPGAVAFVTLHAVGTQNYICLPAPGSSGATSWVFERPEANLSLTRNGLPDIAEHALRTVPGTSVTAAPACTEAANGQHQYCPSWRDPLDGSTVWAEKRASENGGSAPECPNAGAVSCLLLKAVATVGIAGTATETGAFGTTSFVQRLNTSGGASPTGACVAGQIEQVPYKADYVFFRGA